MDGLERLSRAVGRQAKTVAPQGFTKKNGESICSACLCGRWPKKRVFQQIGGRLEGDRRAIFTQTDFFGKAAFHPLSLTKTKKTERRVLMGRKELERYFRKYPDVVTLPDFCQMLGGICDGTARKLLQEQLVEHYVIRTTYYIPKKYVIDYVLSPHYLEFRKKLKAKLPVNLLKIDTGK